MEPPLADLPGPMQGPDTRTFAFREFHEVEIFSRWRRKWEVWAVYEEV